MRSLLLSFVSLFMLLICAHTLPHQPFKSAADNLELRVRNSLGISRDGVYRPVFEKPLPKKLVAAEATEQEPRTSERVKGALGSVVTNDDDFLGVNKITFENGIKLLHKHDDSSPLVSVIFSYHVGSRHETDENQGLAHLLEHMLFKGTRTRPVQFGRLYNVIGSSVNAMTTYGHTTYFHTVHKSAVEPILELEADRMRYSLLNNEQFEKEKRVVMSEVTGNRNSPIMRLMEHLMDSAYKGYWPSRSIGGKSVMNITRDQAVDFYFKNYRTACLTISIVGDISLESAVENVKNASLDTLGLDNPHETASCVANHIPLPIPTTLKPGYNVSRSNDHKVIMKEVDADMSLLEYVVPVCTIFDVQDAAALMVLEALLNGGLMSSALSSLSFPAEGGVMLNLEEDAGWMMMLAGTNPGDFTQIVEMDDALSGEGGLFSQLRHMQTTPITPELVSSAVRAVVDGVRADWFSDTASMAMHLAIDETVTGDYMYTQRLLNATKSVSVHDTVRVAARYLTKQRLAVGAYCRGTQEAEDATKERYGEVDKVSELDVKENRTAAYYRDLQCHIPPAEDIMSYVSHLKYTNNNTEITSLPMAPTLCFENEEECGKGEGVHRPPRPMYLKLKNGMQFLAMQDESIEDSDATFVYGHIDAGAEFDPIGYEGTSMLTALTMQFNIETFLDHKSEQEGIPSQDRGSLGRVVIAPQMEGMVIRGALECGGLDAVLDALHYGITSTTALSAREHQALQSVVGDMADMMAADPSMAVQQLLLSEIFPEDHPLRRIPTKQTINRVPRELVEKFYLRRVCPETVRLAVVSGRYSSDAVSNIHKLAALFESWEPCLPVYKERWANNGTTNETQGIPTPEDIQSRTPDLGVAAVTSPTSNVMEMLKRVSGTTDNDIVNKESEAIGFAEHAQQTMQASLRHTQAMFQNMQQKLKVQQQQQQAAGSFLEEEAEQIEQTTKVPSPGEVAALLGEQQKQQSALLDRVGPPKQHLQFPPIPQKLENKLPPLALQRVQKLEDKLDKAFVNSQELNGRIEMAQRATKELLQEWAFGGPIDWAWVASQGKSLFSPSITADRGFDFLGKLVNFKDKFEASIKSVQSAVNTPQQQFFNNNNDDGRLARSLPDNRGHNTPGRVTFNPKHEIPSILRPLWESSQKSQRPVKDSGLFGVMPSQLRSVDDMFSLISLSFSDMAKTLAQQQQHPKQQQNPLNFSPLNILAQQQQQQQQAEEHPLAAAAKRLATLIDNTPKAPKPKSTAPFSRFSGLRKAMEVQLRGVEKLINTEVAKLPPNIRDKITGANGLRMRGLKEMSLDLQRIVGEIEAKVPKEVPSNIAKARVQLAQLQPDLAKLTALPSTLFVEQETPESTDMSGTTKSDRRMEPTRSGAFGMFELPPIPDEPHYPSPIGREPHAVWIQRKVPGLHEAMTVIMSDSISHDSEHYLPAVVANHIVGGNSLSGKLGYVVRDCKGLTYHIASHLDVSRGVGMFAVQMQTQAGAGLNQSLNNTLNILKEAFNDGFTDAEVGAAKRNLIAMSHLQAADARTITQRILMDLVYDGNQLQPVRSKDTNLWTDLTRALSEMTTEEVNRAARVALDPSKLIILSLAEGVEDSRTSPPDFSDGTVDAEVHHFAGTTPATTKRAHVTEQEDCGELPEEGKEGKQGKREGSPYRPGPAVRRYRDPFTGKR